MNRGKQRGYKRIIMQEESIWEEVEIGSVPAILMGSESSKVILFVCSNEVKSDGDIIAKLADWAVINEHQVLSLVLPEIRGLNQVIKEAERYWEIIRLLVCDTEGFRFANEAGKKEGFSPVLPWRQFEKWLRKEIRLMIETEHFWLMPMIPEELESCLKGSSLVPSSVLTEIIRNAMKSKLDKMKEAPEEVYAWFTYFRILKKDSKEGIGLVGCKGLPNEDGCVEIGYAMASEYRNCGCMTEALEGFMSWLKECPACLGAELNILSANIPSWKVAEKCGFSYISMYDIYKVYRNIWEGTDDEQRRTDSADWEISAVQ